MRVDGTHFSAHFQVRSENAVFDFSALILVCVFQCLLTLLRISKCVVKIQMIIFRFDFQILSKIATITSPERLMFCSGRNSRNAPEFFKSQSDGMFRLLFEIRRRSTSFWAGFSKKFDNF